MWMLPLYLHVNQKSDDDDDDDDDEDDYPVIKLLCFRYLSQSRFFWGGFFCMALYTEVNLQTFVII